MNEAEYDMKIIKQIAEDNTLRDLYLLFIQNNS